MKTLRGKKDWGQLKEKFNKFSGRGSKEVDPRFFVPGKDKEGNVAATIRFLPSPNGEAVVEESRHYFQGVKNEITGNQETYAEPCGRAVKKKCPACEMAGKAYGDGDKNAYKKWGNSSKFVANILVIKDINNPDNNGKVFLWRFGKGIQSMVDDKMIPKSELEESVIVFDYEEGCNFNLIGKPNSFKSGDKMIDYTDFTPSKFVDGKLTEEEIYAADEQLHDMSDWDEGTYYKDYDVCKTRLNTVMGFSSADPKTQAPDLSKEQSTINTEDDSDAAAIDALSNTQSVESDVDDDDAIMARINQLTAED